MLMIMMGDIVGALRAYTIMQGKDLRAFGKKTIEQLGKLRDVKQRMLTNMARQETPKAYSGTNPESQARSADKSAKYNQFVTVSNQALQEVGQTERSLMDALQTMMRDVDNSWNSYITCQQAEARVTERVLSGR